MLCTHTLKYIICCGQFKGLGHPAFYGLREETHTNWRELESSTHMEEVGRVGCFSGPKVPSPGKQDYLSVLTACGHQGDTGVP